MKVKQDGQWKNLGGVDPTKFGNYVLLTADMITGLLGFSTQRYNGEHTHLIIDESLGVNNLQALFRGNLVVKSVLLLSDNIVNTDSMFMQSSIQTVFANTSSVTNMKAMFSTTYTTTLDLSSLDTSKVTDMFDMFRNSQATTLDLSSFDTSNVTSMQQMFYGSQAVTLDLSSFDTSNVTNMNFMFSDSKALTLDLSSFDTSKVTSMTSMFRGSQATTLDLSSFDTSGVTSIGSMFTDSKATIGYARTQDDADRLNASSGKPAELVFVVK